jgi:flagellar biosynthetic protein FliQ
MTETLINSVIKDGVSTALTISAPILLTAIVVGLIISIIQATTQIQEQTLTFVPKLLAVAFVGIVTGSWMLQNLTGFTERIFELIIKIST